MHLIVVEVFEAYGLFVVNILGCLIDILGVLQQGVEGGVELVQAGVCEGIGVDVVEDVIGAAQQFQLHTGLEAGDIAVKPLAVSALEFGFDGAPFFQGFGRDVELSTGELQVTVILVDAIKRLNFGVQRVSFFHGSGPFATLC